MIVIAPRNFNEINSKNAILVGLPFLTNDYNAFFEFSDLEKIKEINEHIIIRADRLVPESELDKYLDLLSGLNYNFLVTDLGVLSYLLKNKKDSLIIYNPETMITNTLDLNTYLDFDNVYVGVSLEVPFDTWKKANRNRIFFTAFGLRKMFDSRRKVFSLYNKEKGIDVEPKNIKLVESSRNKTYLAYEDSFGSCIYRPYYINYLDQDLDFGYLFIDGNGLLSDNYLKVIDVYNKVLSNCLSKEEGINIISSLDILIEDGFKFVDSIYEK